MPLPDRPPSIWLQRLLMDGCAHPDVDGRTSHYLLGELDPSSVRKRQRTQRSEVVTTSPELVTAVTWMRFARPPRKGRKRLRMQPQSPRRGPCRQNNADRQQRISCNLDTVVGPVEQVQVKMRKAAKGRLGDIRRIASHQGEMRKTAPQLGKGASAALCRRDHSFKFDQFVFVHRDDHPYCL